MQEYNLTENDIKTLRYEKRMGYVFAGFIFTGGALSNIVFIATNSEREWSLLLLPGSTGEIVIQCRKWLQLGTHSGFAYWGKRVENRTDSGSVWKWKNEYRQPSFLQPWNATAAAPIIAKVHIPIKILFFTGLIAKRYDKIDVINCFLYRYIIFLEWVKNLLLL